MEGLDNDIETDAKTKLNKTRQIFNDRFSHFMLRTTLVFLVMIVFFGYFVAISSNFNIIGNIHEFNVANVTESSVSGKLSPI